MTRCTSLLHYGWYLTGPLGTLMPTGYAIIVKALSGYGALVTQPQDICPAMERARASGKPSCVNVLLDPDVYRSGTMHQPMSKS